MTSNSESKLQLELIEYNKFERKRRVLKSYLTRMQKFVVNIESTVSSYEIRDRLDEFSSNKRKYDDIQDAIEEIDQQDEEAHEAERSEFEKKHYEIQSKLSALLDNLTTVSHSSTQLGVSGMPFHSEFRRPGRSYLPKLPLPTFSGDYRKWPSFFNTFKTIVHDNEHESNINKFHYLKSCLNGDAQSLLDGLEASELSYDMALKSLDKRYNHKRRIILSHVRGLLNVNRADSTPTSLRLMHTTFLSEINALNALKEPVEQWDTLLIGIMVWKLDDKTLDAWELSLESPVLPTFDDLCKFVEARSNSLEAYEESQPGKSVVTNQTGPTPGLLNKRSVYAATSSDVNSKKCPCCSENHRIYACKKFKEKSPAERIQIVKTGRLCYNCLSDRHTVAQCIGGNFRVCNLKHNSLLHL